MSENSYDIDVDIVDILLDRMSKSKGFPTLSKTVSTVLDSLNYDDVDIASLTETVSSDFSLTQKVLKLVNSPMYASIGRDISTISQAIAIVGFDAISHLALSVKVIDSLAETEGNSSELESTLLAADIARNICASDIRENASIAALMINLGSLLVSHYLKDEMTKINSLIAQGYSLDIASKSVLSLSFRDLGAKIALRWKFPKEIVSTIDGTGDITLINLAKVASTTSKLIIENKKEELSEYLSKAAADFDLNLDTLASVVSLKTEERYNPSARVERRVSLEVDLTALLEDFKVSTAHSLETFTQTLFSSLAIPLGTNRILFLMKTSIGEYKVRYGVGKGVDEIRSSLRISPNSQMTVFQAVLTKKADLMIADATKLRKTAIPEGLDLTTHNIASFLIMPVMVGSTILGFLYFDWAATRQLTNAEINVLHEIRNLILKYIPKS